MLAIEGLLLFGEIINLLLGPIGLLFRLVVVSDTFVDLAGCD
jgi:hypothetical protein